MLTQISTENNRPKLVVILGPTASGKTALALKLAKKFKGEIVSADSRAIYKHLNIGSAKPIKNRNYELRITNYGKKRNYVSQGITHHLIDVVTPDQTLTLAQYKKLATEKIYDMRCRKMVPFLVGGTALYIYALIDNWLIPEVAPQENIRKRLVKRTTASLFHELLKKDPAAQQFIDPKNKRRIIRALEVIAVTGRPFSEQRKKGPPLFDTLILGVKKGPPEIKKNIARRTQQMLKAGLVNEVKKLLKKEYSPNSPALSGIHYKEIINYLQGKISLDEAVSQINKNDEQLVRRQMLWFKKDYRIKWIKNLPEAETLLKKFLQ